MSVAFAIPATTLVLKRLLEKAVSASFPGGFAAVTTNAPPRFDPGRPSGGEVQSEPTALNIFLHHANPNTAWATDRRQRKVSTGELLHNGPLVLNLHYLMSAHGGTLEREMLLGIGMHAMHHVGIFKSSEIAALLASSGNQPADIEAAASEKLWRQVEKLTVSREALDTDILTKLWTAFQAPYRPSVGYLVTTVFLEDKADILEPPPADILKIFVGQQSDAHDKTDELAAIEENRKRAAAGLPELPVTHVNLDEADVRKDEGPP